MERRISAIAELKKSDLVLWRKERIADATVFYKNAVFSAVVQRYFKNPEDAEAQDRLQVRLSKVQESDQYALVFLLDARSVVRMSFPEAPASVASIPTQRISETLRSGQVTFVDFFRNEADQHIYLGVLVPILDGQDGKQSIGILALLIDPEQYLYPYINRWPTTDKTAETLLVRRDSNDVLFLNKLKFNTNTALGVRIPLTNTDVAAVMAAMGKEGIVEAIDYRGAPVMADVHAIPDSPWFMVTREDTSEIYAPLRERLWLMLALVGILLAIVGLSLGLIQRQQKVRFYLMQYETIKKMHESEEDLAITLRSIGDAVIATDTEGRVTRMNPVAEQLTGWPLAEADGKPLEDVFHIINDQTRAPVQNPIAKVMAGGQIVGLANHTALIARDGTVRQIADSAAPIRDEEGRIRGVVLVFHDVTAEYHIKAVLQKKTEELEGFFNISLDLLCIADLEGNFIKVNKAWEDILGYPVAELEQRKFLEFVHPEDMQATLNTMAKLGKGKPILNFTNRYKRKDGNYKFIEWRSAPRGNLIYAAARDITERMLIEENLRERARELNCLYAIADLIEKADSLEKILQGCADFMPNGCSHPETACARIVFKARQYQTGNFHETDWRQSADLMVDDQPVGMIELCYLEEWPIRDEGPFLREERSLINAIAERLGRVIERKRGEAALQEAKAELEEKVVERTRELTEAQDRIVRSEKLAVIGQLASSVAHELRNPLGVMKNAVYYLNMLELGKDNPDIKENLSIISAEIENSDKVISDLLEFSRIKQPALKPEEINLIIKETLNRVTVPAGIKMVAELGEHLPPIQADALQMQLVFYNLAVNAIQAMEKGGILTISSCATHDKNIAIAFKDTGCGIPKENLQKIFEPLFSTKTKGTGLGLAVVASLVEGHDGKLAIESEVGKGSVFTVKLPIK